MKVLKPLPELVSLKGKRALITGSAVGIGKAMAIEQQVKAYGGSRYQLVQDIMNKFSAALEKSKIDIVPKTVVNMGSDKGSGSMTNAFELLLGLIINDKLSLDTDEAKDCTDSQQVKNIKELILKSFEKEQDNAMDDPKKC